ncbi:MAG: hypothetical protein H7Z21_01965 [Hymenobacter sp.]|nr:hypothetical protein [Hymenobacter sp.]
MLKVIERRTGRLVQLLDLDVEEGWDACDNAVRIPDCNFDGHPDLELYAHSGGAGPNIGHVFYLFDPATEQFVFHEGLSDLTQTQVDPATKTISAGWRNGCCHHGSEAYRFLNGQFTLVARHEDDCLGADGYCYVTDGRLVRGKWREKRRKYKLDLVYPEDQGARTSRKKGA